MLSAMSIYLGEKLKTKQNITQHNSINPNQNEELQVFIHSHSKQLSNKEKSLLKSRQLLTSVV